MTKILTEDQVAGFRRDGYLFPLPGLSGTEAAGYYTEFQRIESQCGGKISE
ncbi:uncharacterized protein METZ01_LOCUS430354, partial [marine metagenome]